MKRTLTILLTSLLVHAPVAAGQQPQQTPAQTPKPAATPDVPDWLKNLPPSPRPAQVPAGEPAQGPIEITPSGAVQTVAHDEDDVVRITSNLVQVDALVTDKKGRQVTDLKAEEFEILVDGKPQKITNFSYVENLPEAGPTPAPVAGDKSGVAAPPPARLRPEDVRRTVAFVFNDLEMSWESVYYARRAIQKFVDEQMQPGDFVAILPASGGSGALQQFTNDKRLLNAAIKNLRWQPQFGRGIRPFEAPVIGGTSFGMPSAFDESEAERYFYTQRRERFSIGTLNALDAVVGALRDLPGRKSLVLLSDGIPVPPPDEDSGRVLAGINRVIESANRASVIIYTVDSRGLQTLGLFDASTPGPSGPSDLMAMSQLMSARSREMSDSQVGLRKLAEETGGVAYVNSNDIGGGVRRALDDQRGYYLIGYRPDEGTFEGLAGRMSYHKLEIKVTRPGLKVRTRKGFFGFEGKSVTPATVPRTRAQQLRAALVSPFPAGGVGLRVTSFFVRDPKEGAFVRSLIHLDGRDLTFRPQPDGSYKSVLDVVALTFGAKGLIVNEVNVTHTVSVSERVYKQIVASGMLFNMVVPTKKPGGYQLRVAVRDSVTERTGSASQYVEVPDVKKDRLALSGIVVKAEEKPAPQPAAPAPQPQPQPAPPSEPQTAAPPENVPPPASVAKPAEPPDDGPAPPSSDPQGGPAVRRFRRGTVVDYGFFIYNAKTDRAGGRPQLQTQLRLFRDGKLVFEGKVNPFDGQPLNAQGDIGAGGKLQLGTVLIPGEYALQMIVTDLLAKEKYRVAAQWIDFEIVE